MRLLPDENKKKRRKIIGRKGREGEKNDERAHLVRKTNTLRMANDGERANDGRKGAERKTRITFSIRRFMIILVSAPEQK